MKLFLMVVVLSLPGACQTTGSYSKPKHVFGDTRRDPRQPLESCHGQVPATAAFAPHDRYLQRLLNLIMAANPRTFTGPYAPEKFCIRTVADTSLNATAFFHNRSIDVNSGFLLRAENDAQIAGVLAHELAHITMQHGPNYFLERPEIFQHPTLAASPEFARARADFEAATAGVSEALDGAFATTSAIGDRLWEWELRHRSSFPSTLSERLAAIENDAVALFAEQQNPTELMRLHRLVWRALVRPVTNPNTPPTESEATLAALESRMAAIRQEEGQFVSTELLNARDELIERYVTAKADVDRLTAQKDRATGVLLSVIDELLPAGVRHNWTEQTADEVGYELYLRAGFHPEEFLYITKVLMGDEELDDCRRRLAASPAQIPERGVGTHPLPCWRVYDIELAEATVHREDYAPLLPAATRRTVFPGELEAIQMIIPN